MSIFKKIAGIFSKKNITAVIELTDAQKAIAALKNTEVGAAVAADIKALTSSTLSGPEKFEAVVVNTLPLLVDALKAGGITKGLKEVEDIGRAFVQDVFNSTVSKKAETIGSLLLKVLGLK